MAHARRAFLRRSGLLGIAGSTGLGVFAHPASAETYDYITRETFDTFDRAFHESGRVGQPTDNNEHGALGWGQSYVMQGFMRMYEAYQDTHYLDRLVHNADLILGNRDSARGVADYRGESLPAWRARHPYTVGSVRLADESGAAVLEVRSALAYADDAQVTVRHGSADGLFTLEITNTRYGRTDTIPNLSMDPGSSRYAPSQVYEAYPTRTKATARDLSSAGTGRPPEPGTYAMSSEPVIFAVHTGMICYPLSTFVRTVYGDPKLRRDARYRDRADEYLAAVQDAIAVHDPEWRDGGYFQWPKGMPVPYDGTEQPINQSMTIGLGYLELGVALSDSTYLDRAASLSRMLAGQVAADADNAYVWPYWPTFGHMYHGYTKTGDVSSDISEYTPSYGSPGAGAQQLEDLSHGAIEVEFAALAFRHGVHFSHRDMRRLAFTYTKNLATTTSDGVATTLLRVNGSGGLASSGQYLQSPRWMAVADWDERVFTHSRRIYTDHDVQPGYGSGLACVAYLNWFAEQASPGHTR